MLGETNLTTIFRELDNHLVETALNDNHIFGLIKLIAKSYCKVRFYHLGKEYSQQLTGERVKKKLNKLILFKHQWKSELVLTRNIWKTKTAFLKATKMVPRHCPILIPTTHLRCRYTPNDNLALSLLHDHKFRNNANKVYIFWKLRNCRFRLLVAF